MLFVYRKNIIIEQKNVANWTGKYIGFLRARSYYKDVIILEYNVQTYTIVVKLSL